MNTRTILLGLSVSMPALAANAAAQDAGPVSTSGFVDTSMFVPIAGYAAADDQVTFGLDQVEVDVEVAPTDDTTLRADFNVFPAAGVPTADDLVEQGYLEYRTDSGFFLQAGKRNAPVGAECIDPVDMYQYSYGQLFTSATPSNLTGLFLGVSSGDFMAMAWVSNGWDMPTTPRAATPGLRLELGLDKGHIGLSSTYGPAASDDPYAMVDLDAGFELGSLTLLGEVNVGSADDYTLTGGLVTANYAFTDAFSATLRADYLHIDAAEATDQASVTLAGLVSVSDNFGALAELRTDLPKGADPVLTGAVELTAYW